MVITHKVNIALLCQTPAKICQLSVDPIIEFYALKVQLLFQEFKDIKCMYLDFSVQMCYKAYLIAEFNNSMIIKLSQQFDDHQ